MTVSKAGFTRGDRARCTNAAVLVIGNRGIRQPVSSVLEITLAVCSVENGQRNQSMDDTANTKQLWQTIAYYQKVLALARATKDKGSVPLALYMLGQSYQELELWQEAIDYFTQLLTAFQEREDRRGECRARISLGYLCIHTNQTHAALAHFEVAVQFTRELGELAVEAEALSGLGNALRDAGKADEAATRFQEAIALFEQLGDREKHCQALSDLGVSFAYMHRIQEATSHLNQALTLARTLRNSHQEAHVLLMLAGAYMVDQQTRKECECLAEALAIYRQLGDLWSVAKTLADLSEAVTRDHPTMQALRDGLRLVAEAVEIVSRLDDRELSSYVQDVRGRVYERAGLEVEALASYQKALSLDGRHRQIERLRNVGRMFSALGRPEDALKYDRDALLKALASGNHGAEIQQLILVAEDYLQAGSIEKSCQYLERAIRLSLTDDDAVFTGRLYLRLAQLLSFCQEKQPARVLALWRIGILYVQIAGTSLRVPEELDTLLNPVKVLLAIVGKHAFFMLWALSEPLYHELLTQGESAPTFSRVMAVVQKGDPFAFLDVEQLQAFLSRVNTRQLHDWVQEATESPANRVGIELWAEALTSFYNGISAEERSDWEAALEFYEQACIQAPTFAEAYIHRGFLLAEVIDDEERALADLNRAVELAPDYWQAHYARGHAYFLSYAYDRAIADYTRALDLNALDSNCRYERAVASLEIGDAESAMFDSARLTSEHHYHAAGWLILGRAWLAMREYEQAMGIFTDMIELWGFEDRGNIYYYRALVWLWLGNEKKARADFTRSWQQYQEIKAKIMLIWLAWGEKKPTGRTISSWNEIAAMYFPAWSADLLSQLLDLVRDPDERMFDEFDFLIELEPTHFEAPFWKGMTCAVLGKIDDAVHLWEDALQLHMPPYLLTPLRWLEQEQPADWERVKAVLDRSQEPITVGHFFNSRKTP
jgi:tetratricopeptide (TPR) repeat protein